MALSGLAIYKLLPKTNCKECGYPTCLAFAMKLAAKQAELADCPHVSEEAKQALAESSAPPIRLVKIGEGDRALEVGNETVMFRHEKTFVHPPGLFVRLKDSTSLEELEQRARQVASYSVERVGLDLSLTGVAVEATSADAGRFAAAVEAAHRGAGGTPMVLIARDAEVLRAGAERAGSRPLLWGADQGNWQEVAAVAKAVGAPVVAVAEGDLSALAEVTRSLKEAGVEDIVLDPRPSGPREALRLFTGIRRLALRQNFRDLGYPILATVEGEPDPNLQAILAAQHIAKYGSVIILEEFDPAVAYILLTLRLNMYTDPQKPIQVSPGLYEIGTPQAESPLLVTTNFSLTYFSVSGEVEASGEPAWLLVADAEGLSVLTAWAAGKFDAETIAKAVKQFGAESKTAHRKIILPGFVASLSGELEDELPGWDVLVGPREAVDIPAYLRNWH
ncbi:MAG: acetyl-CoA decarbonylase/synthase complex subunit gamma [Anaerolineae bacterium]|nr:acetyl-CoA decarbonylase/synthase complex subunit gamma [Anaerolineae bacterium]